MKELNKNQKLLNREMKFRGLPKDPSQHGFEFVYGDLDTLLVEGVILIFTKDREYVEVIPETVGQFINKKDKNGVDIYEDDILDLGEAVNGERLFIVKWNPHELRFSAVYNSNKDRYYEYNLKEFFRIDGNTEEGVELVGSIHKIEIHD